MPVWFTNTMTHLLAMAKKIFLMVGAQAVQKYQTKLDREQEVLSHLGDMLISVFAMESALLRTRKLLGRSGEAKAANAIDMTTVFVHEELGKVEERAREALAEMESGDMLRTQLSILKKLGRRAAVDTIGLKRRIAAKVIEAEKYVV